jgi:hypothetical protein
MVVSRSGGGSVVFVDKAAEAVVATDLPDGRCRCRRWLPRLRWLEVERAVGPLRVVVLDVDAQDAFEVAAVEDQQPVETLGADGSGFTGKLAHARRGSERLITARKARSQPVGCGRPVCRRRIASSCRGTKISSSFE